MSVEEESFLLWEPIITRQLRFDVLQSSSTTFSCIEIHFYGCPESEGTKQMYNVCAFDI